MPPATLPNDCDPNEPDESSEESGSSVCVFDEQEWRRRRDRRMMAFRAFAVLGSLVMVVALIVAGTLIPRVDPKGSAKNTNPTSRKSAVVQVSIKQQPDPLPGSKNLESPGAGPEKSKTAADAQPRPVDTGKASERIARSDSFGNLSKNDENHDPAPVVGAGFADETKSERQDPSKPVQNDVAPKIRNDGEANAMVKGSNAETNDSSTGNTSEADQGSKPAKSDTGKSDNTIPLLHPKKPLTEAIFTLYALEDIITRVPPRDDPSARTYYKMKIRSIRRLPMPAAQLARFDARQRLLLDTLRRKAQKSDNSKILELFEDYRKELNAYKELRELLVQINDVIDAKLAQEQIKIDSAILGSGLSMALSAAADGASERETFLAGINGAFAEAWAQSPNEVVLVNRARQLHGAAVKAITEGMDKVHAGNVKKFTAYLQTNNLLTPENEFTLQGGKETPERHANPFVLVNKARQLIDDQNASLDDLMLHARICQACADIVPPDREYAVFRAHFLAVGGLLANQAASRDLGATALPKKPDEAPKGAALALDLWKKYVIAEPFQSNFNDEVYHAVILAYAMAGYPKEAHKRIVLITMPPPPVRPRAPLVLRDASFRPDFWFDCARVCSKNIDLRGALACLAKARQNRFIDDELAKTTPDLDLLRSDTRTRDLFSKLFP